VPVFLILIFLASAVLSPRSVFYAGVFFAQVAFYLTAIVSWMLEKAGLHFRMLALPQYFVITNLASLIAFVKFLSGETYSRWEPSREPAIPRSEFKL